MQVDLLMDKLNVSRKTLNWRFPNELDARYIDGTNWELIDSFSYIDEELGLIIVPSGFTTDFASIPKIFWSIFGAPSNYAPSAIIHDYICRNKIFDRKKCDQVFYRAMIDSDVNYTMAILFYSAVRLYSMGIK